MDKKEQKAFLKKIPKKLIEEYRIHFDEDGQLGIHEPAYINITNPEITRETDTIIEISNDIVSVTLWKGSTIMHTAVSPNDLILNRLKAKELPEELE